MVDLQTPSVSGVRVLTDNGHMNRYPGATSWDTDECNNLSVLVGGDSVATYRNTEWSYAEFIPEDK